MVGRDGEAYRKTFWVMTAYWVSEPLSKVCWIGMPEVNGKGKGRKEQDLR